MDNQELEKTLYFQNPWWVEKRVPLMLLPDFTRPIFKKLKDYLGKLDRILVVKGPRRTGKTTLMYQLADSLIKEGFDPFEILLVSFDDPVLAKFSLGEIFSAYEKISGAALGQKKIYCFLDEVHFSADWPLYVKKYFDRKYPIKFAATSSAASLFKKGLESLAGRTVEEVILPFSFQEFVLYGFRHDKNFLRFFEAGRFTPYADQIKLLFNQYLKKGGFPHILDIAEPALWAKILKEDILEKVIYRDLTKLYNIREPQKMERMFIYLADISAQILNVNNLAKFLSLSRAFVENYLVYLEQAYLVFRLHNFSLSAGKKARSAAKIYLMDAGLINVFSADKEDFILESAVGRELLASKDSGGELYYYRNGYEIDFIFKKAGTILPIEVKNKEQIDGADLKNMFKFMADHKIRKGIIVSNGVAENHASSGREIKVIPAWDFSLHLSSLLQ